MRKFTIVHLYPKEMNIYGDRGNIIALTQRLKWRGYIPEVIEIEPGDKIDLHKADIIFGGGGQDRGQNLIAPDLQSRQPELLAAARSGVVMLTICGTYQLFGRGFKTSEGALIAGINLFQAETVASTKRMIGNIIVSSSFGELVGFENHSGQTYLDTGQPVLGVVAKGYGNNSRDKHEGAIFNNAFGTYLHGPILPKNPRFADELIRRALMRRYGRVDLAPLDDSLEEKAAKVAKTRPQ